MGVAAVLGLASVTALAAVRDHVEMPSPAVLVYGKGGHDHPRMAEAAHYLAQAREALRDADSDFGGHRSQAMALVDQAMEEIRLGFEYGGASHSGPLPPQ
jgi:hypothetical protein